MSLIWLFATSNNAMMKMKYSSKPVVAAPFGMTLGGGAEVCLPAAHIQASAETYMGLVEVVLAYYLAVAEIKSFI